MTCPPDPLLDPPDAVSVPPEAPQSPVPEEVYEVARRVIMRHFTPDGSRRITAADELVDAVWPLAVEAVEHQIIVRRLEKQRQREAGIPEGLSPEQVDALMAEFQAKHAVWWARQRDAIKAEGLREFVTRLDALYEQEKAARPTWDSQAMAFLDGLDRAGYEADYLADFLAPAPDTEESPDAS